MPTEDSLAKTPPRFAKPTQKLRPYVQGVGLMFFGAGFAAFIACATAPHGGFLPIVIESPLPRSEIEGAEISRQEIRQSGIDDVTADLTVSRIYLRPQRARSGWPMVHNSGPGYAYPSELGVVSWYGYDHIGRKTATGAWFNPEAMSAAHKTLPFGTIVRVTRLDTGRGVLVRINDRGPYIEGRIIDLSRKAAKKLGLLTQGVAPCKVEVLKYPLIEMMGPRGNG